MTEPRDSIIEDILQARFNPEDHKTFVGKGGRPMTYVEDEKVMDRLDFALGFGGWGTKAQAVSIEPAIALVTLRVRDPRSGEWTEFSDFGYATNKAGSREPSDEALKEAWTDGFRRVARQPGVARYVYAGEAPAPTTQGQAGTSPSAVSPVESPAPAAPAVPPQSVAAPIASAPGSIPYQNLAAGEGGTCPEHGLPWTVQPGGTSRNGKAYGPFYKCAGKTNGSFCQQKAPQAWVDAHPIG